MRIRNGSGWLMWIGGEDGIAILYKEDKNKAIR